MKAFSGLFSLTGELSDLTMSAPYAQSGLCLFPAQTADLLSHEPDSPLCTGDIRIDSHSKTLLELYQTRGAAIFPEIRGDFSASLFCPTDRTLYLMTDPLGVRPLYYSTYRDTVYFSNSLDRLLTLLPTFPDTNEAVLAEYLAYRFDRLVHETFFENVFRVPAGHFLLASPKAVSLNRYFTPNPDAASHCTTDADYIEAYSALLKQAVGDRLPKRSTAFIQVSGGMDSSSIAAFASELSSPGQHRALANLTPNHPDECELKFQREALARCENLTPEYLNAEAFFPFAELASGHHPNLLEPESHPQKNWLLGNLRYASSMGSQCILTGAGGDTALGAHLNYAYPVVLRDYPIRTALRELPYYLQEHTPYHIFRSTVLTPAARRLLGRKLSRRMRRSSELTRSPWVRSEWYFSHAPYFSQTLMCEHRSISAKLTCDWYHLGSTALWHSVNQQLTEKAGAQFSHPFFDARLLEFMLQIPPSLRMKDGVNKVIAREAMKNELPKCITHRLDSRPASESITRGLSQLSHGPIEELFTDSLLVSHGYIKPEILQNEFTALLSGKKHDYQPMINAVNAELWLRHCSQLRMAHEEKHVLPRIIAA